MPVAVNNEPVEVVVWDPAGQEQFQSITKNFFTKVDAVVLVFDMTQENSFESVLRWFQQVKDIKDCPVFILGNKCDKTADVCISEEALQEVRDLCQVPVFKVSGFTNLNLEESFF